MKQITLGSLFDGSGGFPLAGALNGIKPVWASEIEPFPIRVTSLRFPNMKHLGDVRGVRGDEIEPVDIITFGSPCQDLSVAGTRSGLHRGERSSLFFEAIRIIREMREHDRAAGRADQHLRPRFAVFENVPGAFSSNKGQDFRAVLQAFCSIRGGRDHIVPMPPNGKWLPSGCIVGDGWSVAWNVYDAQRYVPQRRKRIYLIADFASDRAGKILFESESVSGDSQPGETPWESFARHHAGSAGGNGFVFDARGNGGGYISPTITGDHENRVTDYTAVNVELCFGGTETNAAISSGDKAQCLTARAGTGGGNVPTIILSETGND